MKMQQHHAVAYTEVKPDYTMQLRSLLGLLQDAAVAHSEQAGFGSRRLLDAGKVWILNKMAVDTQRMPRYQETVRVETWHRGSRGFRAYRDFLVFVGSERIAAATSLWLYFDLCAKRLQRIPQQVGRAYTEEPQEAGCADLDAWKPAAMDGVGFEVGFITRSSDFDPLGHVNHTVYFDMLETLVERSLGRQAALRRLRIHFQKEIPREVTHVKAGIEDGANGGRFRIYSERETFAAGEMEIR
ncbi:MAG: acyl-ACP thioesterase domain-containing protein [Desulfobacteraceae bacterium]|jgi:acyl-ACP thioesterase|nr:acyl-ACP thioesterase domain-containing protein [Desulfobacteraceae bacterium]